MPGDSNTSDSAPPDAISTLVIEGFKSLAERTEIEIRPLTLLAGANSSGKSSALQPLLLLKQTLESPFDPGPLLLDGPNVRFTSSEQMFARVPSISSSMEIGIFVQSESVSLHFAQQEEGLKLETTTHEFDTDEGFSRQYLREGMTPSEFQSKSTGQIPFFREESEVKSWKIEREKCFLYANCVVENDTDGRLTLVHDGKIPASNLDTEDKIHRAIHVPGLRDNPSRTYRTTAVGDRFPGTFDDYVASVIHSWQREGDERLEKLVGQLQHVGLTGGIESDRVNDTQVELRVEQQPVDSDAEGRMINVADVGLGVSQVLPVLVACLVADEGQLVYLEQPEIHLHPRAQTRLADVLVEAANRGVRVVVETHSQLLLLAIQTRIAEDQIDPERVMLHWFSRREDGVTEVDSRQPDEKGAFGDWPEDFSEVEMEAENRYLDAAERHLFKE